MFRRSLLSLIAIASAPVALAACGGDDAASGGTDKPVVAATAPQVDVLARALAGDGVTVAEVVPATADVHDLELRPSQVRTIKDADLLLRPGRENDAWAAEALESASGDQLDVAADVAGQDRHWWMDPAAAMTAADAISGALDELDAGGAAARAERLKRLRASLEAVDAATKQCLAAVPQERRRIVTDHDAIGAYAARYGLEIVGTIAPGSEPEAAPSAKRLVELERTMRERGVTAVFPIAPHGSRLVGQVAERGGARAGEPLWADALPGAEHDHAHEGEEDAHEGEEQAGETHKDEEPASTTREEHDPLIEAAHLNGRSVAAALRAPAAACRGLQH